MHPNNYYEENFVIRSSEVAPDGKSTMPAICNLLQEVAGNHALKLDFDISHLMEQNLTWVLHRLHVKMEKFPAWRDSITIRTWPSSGDTLRAYRDFLIFDDDGNEIGKSLSYWLILNLESRRPVRIPKNILEMAPTDVQHVLEVQKQKLQPVTEYESETTYHVRRSDLDLNKHVNNVRYIEWTLDERPSNNKAQFVDIEFHAECDLEDKVVSKMTASETGFHHQLERQKDQKIVARAVSS